MNDVDAAVMETVRRMRDPAHEMRATQRAELDRWWVRGGQLKVEMTNGTARPDGWAS